MRRPAPMPWWFWAAGAAVLLGTTGTLFAVGALSRNQMRQLLREAARRYNINPELPDAVGKIESGWNSRALNCAGADGARGCAIGATQITLRTAQDHGFYGTADQLRSNPALQAELTAKILAAGNVSTTSDAAAWWNAGKRSIYLAPAITREDYLPKLVAAHSYVQANPPT